MNITAQTSTANEELELIFIPKGQKKDILSRAEFSSFASVDALLSDFDAEKSSILKLFPDSYSASRVWLIGLGDKATTSNVRLAVRTAFHQLKKLSLSSIALNLNFVELSEWESIRYSVRGIVEGLRTIDARKKAPASPLSPDITLISSKWTEKSAHYISDALAIAELRSLVSDWVDAPANELKPQSYAQHIQSYAETLGVECELFHIERLSELGLNGIVAVGQGSEDKPVMVELRYTPKHASKDAKKIALIGKGVTFDTGGVSIKGSTNLHWMKCDMGGSSVAVAAVFLAARLELPFHVVGVVGLAENMIDGRSYLPSSIIKMYSGHSAEVIDTDAEGRMVLADCLAWANKHHAPDYMLDFATLTGSCVSALGYHAAGLFSASEELASSLLEAGTISGDRVWRLPLWEEYSEQIQSDMADVKNLGGPAAGAITAAKFLEIFTENHPNWAHIDIAGVSLAASGFAKDRTATGFGVDLMYDWLTSIK